MFGVGTPSSVIPGTLAPLNHVLIWPFDPLTSNSTHSQVLTGRTTLAATPAGLWSGRVASSDWRFHMSAPFWPPSRRSVLPFAESFMARKVTWPAGSGVVCIIQKRAENKNGDGGIVLH